MPNIPGSLFVNLGVSTFPFSSAFFWPQEMKAASTNTVNVTASIFFTYPPLEFMEDDTQEKSKVNTKPKRMQSILLGTP